MEIVRNLPHISKNPAERVSHFDPRSTVIIVGPYRFTKSLRIARIAAPVDLQPK